MHEKFNAAVPTRGDDIVWPTIYKVPWELKRGDEGECYEPVAARIGPFAGNNEGTVQLESYKWCCTRQLIFSRLQSSDDIAEGQLALLLKSMKRLEQEIRACYCQEIEDDSDELALSMLLDGCFILHRLLKHARRGEIETHGGVVDEDEKDDDWTQVFGRVCVWQLVTREPDPFLRAR